MVDRLRERLELLALSLAGIVVAIHLWWGIQRFVERYLIAGVYIDPRPGLFVVSSLLVVAGVIYVYLGGRRLPVYVGGVALMVTYVSGYVWWHTAGHHAALPWVEFDAGHHHDLTWTEFVVEHARTDTIAMVSKAAEVALIVLLTALAVLDYRGDERAIVYDRDERPSTEDRDERPSTEDRDERSSTEDRDERSSTEDRDERPSTEDRDEQPAADDCTEASRR